MRFGDCKYLMAGIAALTIGGCGGGGGSNDGASNTGTGSTMGGGNQLTATANEAEGYYANKLVNEKSYGVIVLDDGEFWILSSGDNGNSTQLITGLGAAQNGSFSATNALNFNLISKSTPLQASISATYRVKSTFNAAVSENSKTESFSANYDPNYTQPFPLSTIAGNYKGSFIIQGSGVLAVSATSFNLTIANTGTITGSLKNDTDTTAACTFQGSVTQRSITKNPYRISISINESNCFIGVSTLTGIFNPYVESSVQKGNILSLTQDKSKVLVATFSK